MEITKKKKECKPLQITRLKYKFIVSMHTHPHTHTDTDVCNVKPCIAIAYEDNVHSAREHERCAELYIYLQIHHFRFFSSFSITLTLSLSLLLARFFSVIKHFDPICWPEISERQVARESGFFFLFILRCRNMIIKSFRALSGINPCFVFFSFFERGRGDLVSLATVSFLRSLGLISFMGSFQCSVGRKNAVGDQKTIHHKVLPGALSDIITPPLQSARRTECASC